MPSTASKRSSINSCSIGLAPSEYSTIAPAGLVGYEFIDRSYFGENGQVWLAHVIDVAVGGGYDGAVHRGFATARLAAGMIFDVEDGRYVQMDCDDRGEPCASHMMRHRAELEVVLQLRIGADGERAQLSLGIAFDPIRIWHEAAQSF